MSNVRKPLVLLADDIELNRAFLNDILSDEYRVIEAASGREAVEVIQNCRTELAAVLLSARMSEPDGFQALSLMGEKGWLEEIPVILILGEASPDDIARGYELGAVDSIGRPFDVTVIKRRIRNMILLYSGQRPASVQAEKENSAAGRTASFQNEVSRSISERTAALLEQERTKYQHLAALSDEITFEYDAGEDVLTVAERGSRELGIPLRVTGLETGEAKLEIFGGEDRKDLAQRIRRLTPELSLVQVRYLLHMPSGLRRWYEFTIRGMWADPDGKFFQGFIGKAVNIHEKQMESARLRKMAEQDALTGLYNHTAARRRISSLLEMGDVGYSCSALLFIDIDNFKEINDTYGHLFGDEVLCSVAGRILHNVRNVDVGARIGGDEFLLFLRNAGDREMIERHVARIYHALNREYESCPVSCSVGVAVFPQDGKDYRVLLGNADTALYAAKNAGKSRYLFYDQIGPET